MILKLDFNSNNYLKLILWKIHFVLWGLSSIMDKSFSRAEEFFWGLKVKLSPNLDLMLARPIHEMGKITVVIWCRECHFILYKLYSKYLFTVKFFWQPRDVYDDSERCFWKYRKMWYAVVLTVVGTIIKPRAGFQNCVISRCSFNNNNNNNSCKPV